MRVLYPLVDESLGLGKNSVNLQMKVFLALIYKSSVALIIPKFIHLLEEHGMLRLTYQKVEVIKQKKFTA